MAKEVDGHPNIQTSRTSSAVRLAKAIDASDKRFEHYRKHTLALLKEFCGPYYTSRSAQHMKREPVNTIATIVAIMIPNLAGTRVKSQITTKRAELRAFADLFKLLNDHVLDQIDYAGTFMRVVTSALFGMGITKTILDVEPLNDDPDFPNWLQDAGFPYVGQVDSDNYVLDPACTMREACAFEGDKFLIPVKTAVESGEYDVDALKQLDIAYHNQIADGNTAGISKGQGDLEQYEDFYQLVSVYLPREKMIVTLPSNEGESAKYLKEAAYEGPEGGPYDMLGFYFPPNNALPVPPVSMYFDLHLSLNEMVRKMARQSKRSKDIGLFQLSKTEDAKAIKNSSDGDMIGVSDPKAVGEFHIGGADPELYKAVGFVRELLNWVAHNPDSIGGLAAGEKTLGQDEMKLAQAGAVLAHMQATGQKFSKSVLRKVSWYNWTDPQTRVDLVQSLPGGLEISRIWSPDVREGEFPDYQSDVEPFVVSAENPLEQYRRMTQLATQIIIPLADKLMAQGKDVDVAEMIGDMSKSIDVDTSKWITEAPAPVIGLQPSASPGGGQGGQGNPTRGPQPGGSPANAPQPQPQGAGVA